MAELPALEAPALCRLRAGGRAAKLAVDLLVDVDRLRFHDRKQLAAGGLDVVDSGAAHGRAGRRAAQVIDLGEKLIRLLVELRRALVVQERADLLLVVGVVPFLLSLRAVSF